MSWVRTRLTFSNVIAFVALFALLGGGAYAASKVGSKDIKKNAVRSKHIKNKQVKSADLANGAVKKNGLAANAKAMWAKVRPDGEITAQSGGITAERDSDGQYTVDFGANVSNRAIVASAPASLGQVTAQAECCPDPGESEVSVQTWFEGGSADPAQLNDHLFTILAIP